MEEEFLTNVALDRFFIFFQKVAPKSFSCVSSRKEIVHFLSHLSVLYDSIK